MCVCGVGLCCIVLLLEFKQIQYQEMIEQSKSPKSCAYARLGKHLSGKHSVPQENIKINRNSTGNIYEEILKQFDTDQGKYIRELVNKNQDGDNLAPIPPAANHNRRKSYAELVVEQPQEKGRVEEPREERETLCKPKYPKDNVFLHQMTPKNTAMTRSDFIKPSVQYQSASFSGFVKKNSFDKKEEASFIDSLSSYLQSLNDTIEHSKPPFPSNQRLAQTLKIGNPSHQSHTLASKLQQSVTKIKQLKLKNHFMQKEINQYTKRQRKMKDCLHEMLEEIREMNEEVARQKKERKRLERIIQALEMQSQKAERKTIGKASLTKIEEFQHKINQFSQHDDRSDEDSSFQEAIKYSSTNGRQTKGPSPFRHQRQHSYIHRGILDSNKIDELFKSSYHSDDEESYQ